MAAIAIDINKSIEENAGLYYEKAKKLKKKLKGAEKAIEEMKKKLIRLEQLKELEEKSAEKISVHQKKEWYEKFRWFISSEGFLCIGGRDATTNEIIVKKHAESEDIVFHTDMVGSPFFVVKTENKKPTGKTLSEAADATVTFSRAWKLNMQSTPAFYCKPEQLTKEAPPGEYIPRGGFVTKGKLNYIENKINLAVGITKEGKIMSGPLNAIKANCEKYVEMEQGKERASKAAKQIQYKIGGSMDYIIAALPAGGCKVRK